MKVVGRVPLARLREQRLVRLAYAPFDVCVGLVDGVPHAIEDACNHAGASISEGQLLRRDRVICPVHGYVFSIRTGELVAPKGLCGPQRTFVTRVEGDDVVVEDHFDLVIR
jgi:nitrite reductase/ring-hydroxylating ferredoxin subunit